MNDRRVVVVTGVAGEWGGRVAGELLKLPGWTVIGLDRNAPDPEIEDLDFIQAGVGNPALADLFKAEAVDIVCHLDFVETVEPSETAFEHNVMDSMKLFGACVEAGVGKIVLRSSTLVYGAQPENSAFLREEHPLHGSKRYGSLRDLVELEAFCSSFRQQSPQTQLVVLRFAHIVGPKADTPLTRFLREEQAITLMGFDPIMQVIHEDDVVGALVQALTGDAQGIFNVAADPLMPLWRVMGLAGKLPVPVLHPLAQLIVSAMGTRYAPIDLDYLRYRCVGDLAKMRAEFNYVPHHAADEALRELGRQRRGHQVVPSGTPALEETQLRDTIARRRARRGPAPVKSKAARAARARKPKTPASPAGAKQLTSDEENANG